MYGATAAAEVARFETANVYAMKELIESEGLDCDVQLTRAVDVYLDAEHAENTEAAWRSLKEDGHADLSDVTFIPKRDAERISSESSVDLCNTDAGFATDFGCKRCLLRI